MNATCFRAESLPRDGVAFTEDAAFAQVCEHMYVGGPLEKE